MKRSRIHRIRQAYELAWHKRSLELLPQGEFVLGISFSYDKDPYLNHQYLRVAALVFGLYLEWRY